MNWFTAIYWFVVCSSILFWICTTISFYYSLFFSIHSFFSYELHLFFFSFSTLFSYLFAAWHSSHLPTLFSIQFFTFQFNLILYIHSIVRRSYAHPHQPHLPLHLPRPYKHQYRYVQKKYHDYYKKKLSFKYLMFIIKLFIIFLSKKFISTVQIFFSLWVKESVCGRVVLLAI